jgi:hypothetical protein
MTADAMAEEPDSGSRSVRHVLVPVDGSELALHAMPTARVLASALALRFRR